VLTQLPGSGTRKLHFSAQRHEYRGIPRSRLRSRDNATNKAGIRDPKVHFSARHKCDGSPGGSTMIDFELR
jgi:hypothetical protein